MGNLRVSLFGHFRAQCDESILTDLYPPKLRELLCYLLVYRDRAHSRETLAGLLWGDSSTARSKKYLRQALWQLQHATDSRGVSPNRDLLVVDPDRIRINPAADLWLDVAVFERALARAQGVSGAALDAQQAHALCDAAELYQGDLLEGWFQDWCLFERERLQNMYLVLLDKLMDYCEAHDSYEAGLDYGMRSLRYDQARERTHRRLMRLYYLAGDRTAALRQYDCCVEALRRELAVRPSARTTALYQQIRTEEFSDPARSVVARPLGGSHWPEAIEHLRCLQKNLTEVQDELRRAIRAVEMAMRG